MRHEVAAGSSLHVMTGHAPVRTLQPPVLGARAPLIERLIGDTDYVRRSPFAVGGPGHHKEWEHFAILAPGLDLLVNFSACDDARPGAAQGAEVPRIVVLARAGGTWDGDVEPFSVDAARIRGGRIDMTLAHNRLRFHNGVFTISAVLRERPIAIELCLRPITVPSMTASMPVIGGPPLHWVVVPRLAATGTVTIDGRVHRLDRAPAYHDHNWGHFLWGSDVSWEWGFVLPERPCVPWCLTFVRLTNRARTLALAHKLLVWKHERLVCVFRESDLESRTDLGYLHPARVFKIPRPMALVHPDLITDVPRAIETRVRAGVDWLDCRCEPDDMAQVLIPAETRFGVTIFNEVTARSTVHGRINGEAIAFEGRSILEFIRDY